MKLSQYAQKIGVTYKTAYRMFKRGELDAYQLGLMLVREGQTLDLKEVRLPQQPIYVNTHCVSSELGI